MTTKFLNAVYVIAAVLGVFLLVRKFLIGNDSKSTEYSSQETIPEVMPQEVGESAFNVSGFSFSKYIEPIISSPQWQTITGYFGEEASIGVLIIVPLLGLYAMLLFFNKSGNGVIVIIILVMAWMFYVYIQDDNEKSVNLIKYHQYEIDMPIHAETMVAVGQPAGRQMRATHTNIACRKIVGPAYALSVPDLPEKPFESRVGNSAGRYIVKLTEEKAQKALRKAGVHRVKVLHKRFLVPISPTGIYTCPDF